MYKKRALIICILLTIIIGMYAEDISFSAKEYMRGMHLFGGFQSIEMNFSMSIKSPKGVKERQMKLLMDRQERDEKLLISILEPAFLSNMKYLSVSQKGRENQWMRTSRGVRRLSSRNNSDSLFGSDFTIEDLALTDLDNFYWSYELSGSGVIKKIRAVPVYDTPAYSYKIFTVDEENRLLTGIQYFNESEKLIKEYSLVEQMNVDQFVFPKRVRMKDLEEDSSTTLIIGRVSLDPELSQGVFSKGNL